MGKQVACMRALWCIVLFLLHLEPVVGAKSLPRKRSMVSSTSWKSLRDECDKQVCWHLPAVEADNCAMQCQAPSCWAAVYSSSPLEPGEVDGVRAAAYNRCLQDKEKVLRGAKMWPPKLDASAGRLREPAQPATEL